MKRAVLYPRVSTDEQAGNYSLPTQLEACRKYAQDNGFEVAGEFCEDFTGTVPIESRPEGSKAYAMLADGEADALIAYRIDRIVRPPEEGDEWDMPILIRGLAKLGKELHTCDRGHLGTSFADLLIAMLDAKSAGDERRKLLERSKRGKNGKVQRGKPYCGGFVPYGYETDGDKFLIVEPEAKVIRMIYEWYVMGDGEDKPMSMHAIATNLSKMGIATPGERRPLTAPRKRKPSMWNHYAVSRILKNEAYAGTWYFGADNISVSIPHIVDRDIWDQAQSQREHNRKTSPRKKKRKYLLSGLVQCDCGCNLIMIGEASRHGTRYYRSRHERHAELEKSRCIRSKMIRADMLEHAAWEWLSGAITNSDDLEEEMRKAQRLGSVPQLP